MPVEIVVALVLTPIVMAGIIAWALWMGERE